MEFMLLIFVYCILFILGSLCLLYRDAAILNRGLLGSARQFMYKAVDRLVPGMIQEHMLNLCNYLLYKRNSVFQLMFIGLCILAHVVWAIDMLPNLYRKYPDQNHTFWPFAAVFANYFCLHKAWTGDPGEITKKNCDVYAKVYKYDDILYERNAVCTTCNVIKTPRSKHCSVCNRCVHRFDHHCIWTNNCVGAFTHRYFILFMVTIIVGFIHALYVSMGCVLDYAEEVRLFNASYVDYDDTVKPMTISVAFQHLFMALPRVIFLICAMCVLIVLIMIFLTHHLYLIATNQTTNERYKVQAVRAHYSRLAKESRSENKNQRKSSQKSTNNKKDKMSNKVISADEKTIMQIKRDRYRPYSLGVLNNFMEVFFPYNFIDNRLNNS